MFIMTSSAYAYRTEADCEEFEGKGQCCKASDGTFHRNAACGYLTAAAKGDIAAHNNWVMTLAKEYEKYEAKSQRIASQAKPAAGSKNEKTYSDLVNKAADDLVWAKAQLSKAKVDVANLINLSGWNKIGETTLTLNSNGNKGIVVFDKKAAGCTAIKIKVKEAPINLVNLEVTFEIGDKQLESLNKVIQSNEESQSVNLKCRVANFNGNKIYINQSGDCLCEDGTVCHKSGTSPGNCAGCGGDACKNHGGFAAPPAGGYGVHRNMKEMKIEYQKLPKNTAKAVRVEVWGFKSSIK